MQQQLIDLDEALLPHDGSIQKHFLDLQIDESTATTSESSNSYDLRADFCFPPKALCSSHESGDVPAIDHDEYLTDTEDHSSPRDKSSERRSRQHRSQSHRHHQSTTNLGSLFSSTSTPQPLPDTPTKKMANSNVPTPGPAKLTKGAGLDEWLSEAMLCHYLPEAEMKQLCEFVKECLMEGEFIPLIIACLFC